MRHLALSVAAIFFIAATLASAANGYLTEEEIDIIRDAQGLEARVPAYFRLAEKRLVVLGVSEKSARELEKERKQQEEYEKEKKKAGDKADKVKPPVNEYDYLLDFTRAELLRGYVQIIDEVMSNLDDAYNRKLEVRDALEALESFSSETLGKIRKFEPKNQAETLAREASIEKANEALNGAKEALTIVPKTERKKK